MLQPDCICNLTYSWAKALKFVEGCSNMNYCEDKLKVMYIALKFYN